MNSLPFISHHLFVAAVGNERRRREKPMKRGRPNDGPGEHVIVAPLAAIDAQEPVLEAASPLFRARSQHARA